MTLPSAMTRQIATMTAIVARVGFVPVGAEQNVLMDAARREPAAILPYVSALCDRFNNGGITAGNEAGRLGFLTGFASISEELRKWINEHVDRELLEYHVESEQANIAARAKQLSDVIRVGRPRHY